MPGALSNENATRWGGIALLAIPSVIYVPHLADQVKTKREQRVCNPSTPANVRNGWKADIEDCVHWCQREAMNDTPTTGAARSFLQLIFEGQSPNDEELARALDELAMAYHETPEGGPADDDDDYPHASLDDYKRRYAQLASRFPNHGYYAVTDPNETVPQESLVGDAIDDLADIARELQEVLWRLDRFGADDAHWHFKLGYRTHWGLHLRELSHYLHAKIW